MRAIDPIGTMLLFQSIRNTTLRRGGQTRTQKHISGICTIWHNKDLQALNHNAQLSGQRAKGIACVVQIAIDVMLYKKEENESCQPTEQDISNKNKKGYSVKIERSYLPLLLP